MKPNYLSKISFGLSFAAAVVEVIGYKYYIKLFDTLGSIPYGSPGYQSNFQMVSVKYDRLHNATDPFSLLALLGLVLGITSLLIIALRKFKVINGANSANDIAFTVIGLILSLVAIGFAIVAGLCPLEGC